jgi:hypothetical protein
MDLRDLWDARPSLTDCSYLPHWTCLSGPEGSVIRPFVRVQEEMSSFYIFWCIGVHCVGYVPIGALFGRGDKTVSTTGGPTT